MSEKAWSTFQRDNKAFFRTAGGVELELMPIPPMVYRRFMIEQNKDAPPVPFTTIRKSGREEISPNYNDSDYKDAVFMHKVALGTAIQSFVLSYVKIHVPKAFESVSESERERKIDYVSTLIGSDAELDDLLDAITELSMPTEKSVTESEDTFQSSGE